MGGANIQIVHYFDQLSWGGKVNDMYSFSYFWRKIFDRYGHYCSSLPNFSLIKNNILHQSKNYKNHFENSNFWGMWPLGHVGHVTYSFINMLFISTGIFDDKLRPQILSVGTTYCKFPFNWRLIYYTVLTNRQSSNVINSYY